ncbi:MAG: uL15 family ribosomal protein [bacterium]|nr:uL15 family ribosomal protein [bacterium]
MQLHTLHAATRRRPTKRVGRGGKRGTTSGKGTKGQRSRSGHRIRPAARDLVLKFPKLRGVGNSRRSVSATIVKTGDIPALLARARVAELTREVLVSLRKIRAVKDAVKVVANGKLASAVAVNGIPATKGAKAEILKFGGTVS